MTFEAIERAARADRDAQPLAEADLKRMKRTPRAKIIRRALELTQEEFAARYHIPLGTLRDWEQGRAEPDQPTRAYLTMIARDPEHVDRMLNAKARQQVRFFRNRKRSVCFLGFGNHPVELGVYSIRCHEQGGSCYPDRQPRDCS
jgi:putative transcriptional regulator